MARKIILTTAVGEAPILEESLADDEAQLQELVRAHPDLISAEDIGLDSPLMVIGRETGLPSGAVDLVLLARSGDLIVAEFKTGPQNSDFRAALAQLIDYGSDLWQLSYEEFEGLVPLRYFASDRCDEEELKGIGSLEAAAQLKWPELEEEELSAMRETLSSQLSTGSMHYALMAQRFSPPILRSIEYLNHISSSNFYAIEVVRFIGEEVEAFESRVLLRPMAKKREPSSTLNESDFISKFDGAAHSEAVKDIIRAVKGLGGKIYWGTVGISIRVPVPDRSEPMSVGWINPPGERGWGGLTDVNLGYDSTTLALLPLAARAIRAFGEAIANLDGAKAGGFRAVEASYFGPDETARHKDAIVELLAQLVREIQSDEGTSA